MAASDVGEDETGSFEVATWRLVTLFLMIIIFDTAWEAFDEFVTHRLQTRMHIGLKHAWEQLKFETMALGLISLLLVVGEEQLLKICINSPDDEKHTYGDDAKTGDSAYAEAGAPSEAYADDHHRRRLMAAAGGATCPEGKEPLWESELIHKAHILIFLIAACHIAYAMISIALSMLSMRRWHKFEQLVSGGELLPLPLGGLQRQGEPAIVFGLRQCLRQFTHPLDVATYSALRALFIDRVNAAENFNFAAMIQEYLTEEFARVVRFDVIMWGIALLWMVFPEGSYGGFWTTSMFMILSVVAGAKLTTVTMHLARYAYGLYYEQPLPPRGAATLRDAGRELEVSLRSDGGALGAGNVGRGGSGDADKAPWVGDATALGDGGVRGKADGTQGSKTGPESRKPAQATNASAVGSIIGTTEGLEAPPSHTRAFRRAIRGHSQRIKASSRGAAAEERELLSLFWLRRPRLMLHVFRYAFFQNAIAIAAVIFGFWQEEYTIFGGAVQGYGNTVRAVAYVLLFFVVVLLVHTSMILFPLYALAAGTAEFGSPSGVLNFARRRAIRPDLVRFLEETAPQEKDEAVRAAESKPKPKCDIGGSLLTHHKSIPEHKNGDADGSDDEEDDPLPAAAVLGAGGAAQGPEAISAAPPAQAGSLPGAATAVPAAGKPSVPLRGASSSAGSPARSRADSGSLTGSSGGGGERPAQVSLAHAYSEAGAAQHSSAPQTLAALTPSLHTVLTAEHSHPAAHTPHSHAHAPGMAMTVQGLLEAMAARRAESLTARMRLPRR